jgi:hydroxyacylglutathione hydrolase
LIIPLHAANPGHFTGSGNWTYLLAGVNGVLIDAGVGKRDHLDRIAEHAPEGPQHVIVTHIHEDHASGAAAIAERWPHTRFYKFLWPGRDQRYAIDWIPLIDGAVVASGDSVIEVVHTPGHSPDHICLWHAATRTLFSADLVVKGSTVVIPASHGGSLVAYLKSLQRVRALGAQQFLPAHGEPIDDPEALIASYLKHRSDRERQVLEALRVGHRTIDAITSHIYRDLAAPLLAMARESVLAHLIKLQDDGVVDQLGDTWTHRPTT